MVEEKGYWCGPEAAELAYGFEHCQVLLHLVLWHPVSLSESFDACDVDIYRSAISPRGLAVADQGNYKHKSIDILKVGRPLLALGARPIGIGYVERATNDLEYDIATRAWLGTAFKSLFIMPSIKEVDIDTICQVIRTLA